MDAAVAARYARQILLVEIGVKGQERILSATAALEVTAADDGLARTVAERYARRAGFCDVGLDAASPDELAPRDLTTHAAPRAVLAGARAAARAIRKAIA
jgi:hypothetical protein